MMSLFFQNIVFPFAAALNFFSITALMILAGVFGNAKLAAEIGVVQGAIIAVFISFSGNARNLILARSTHVDEKSIACFRSIILLPALIVVYFLSNSVIEIPQHLVIGLIIRRSAEWFAELQLANREKEGDFKFGQKYAIINSAGLMLIGLVLSAPLLPANTFFMALYLWAVLPMVLLLPYLRDIANRGNSKLNFSPLIPHMGSTVVIGISTYIFRILIALLAGKILAGQMFVAYALGGVVSSVYANAIGPTLMRNNSRSTRFFVGIVFACIAFGGLVILSTLFWKSNVYPPVFVLAIGFSLIGGGVMMVAQRQRLHILQIHKKDVFVPDALSNIILISSITFAFNIFGEISLALFFLWSALLALLFYWPLSIKINNKC
jgi:hypothetical protein